MPAFFVDTHTHSYLFWYTEYMKLVLSSSRKMAIVKKNVSVLFHRLYDPFHDGDHAIEVEKTAQRIYRYVKPAPSVASLHHVRLLSLLHDTSRKVIGTNLFLEPLMGGYISGRIGYWIMRDAGYSHQEASYIRSIIRNHESFLGLWKYPLDTNAKIFVDADNVEAYSPKRLSRALRYFEEKKFSNGLLNMYIYGLTMAHTFLKPEFHFAMSKHIRDSYIEELRINIKDQKHKLEYMLYRHVFKSFIAMDIFR